VQQRPEQEEIADDDPSLLLLYAKAAKLVAIDTAFSAALTYVSNGVAFQVDATSQQRITSWGALAMGVVADVPGVTWPDNFVWVAADNNQHPFVAAADFFAFAQGAALRVTALILNARTLKDATAAATTTDDLAAVDPSSGWSS
jgi:hypothetical protein